MLLVLRENAAEQIGATRTISTSAVKKQEVNCCKDILTEQRCGPGRVRRDRSGRLGSEKFAAGRNEWSWEVLPRDACWADAGHRLHQRIFGLDPPVQERGEGNQRHCLPGSSWQFPGFPLQSPPCATVAYAVTADQDRRKSLARCLGERERGNTASKQRVTGRIYRRSGGWWLLQ